MTACDSCGESIPLAEDRRRCLDCLRDLCMSCEECSAHTVVTYFGFREVADFVEVLTKADEYVKDACGRFSGRDDIYIAGVQKLVAFLLLKLHDSGAAAAVLQEMPLGLREAMERHGESWLRRWVSLRSMGRYVDYFARRAIAGRLPDDVTWLHAQGGYGPMTWKGRPLMRTVWDLALSSIMLEEIRPRTVIELGTASGASAMWYADLQRLLGIEPCVKTVDIDPPKLECSGVTFLRGDAKEIGRVLPHDLLEAWPHPWLVIEDAHENIRGVLEHIHGVLRPDDYITIEDVDAEQALGPFLLNHPGSYMVDARYTDYFGHNATCCADQIFRRTHPGAPAESRRMSAGNRVA